MKLIFLGINAENLKYISLFTLTVQNSAVSLSMRYAKTRDGDIFFSSTGKTEISHFIWVQKELPLIVF
jgi:Nucleotide-sugar transporter